MSNTSKFVALVAFLALAGCALAIEDQSRVASSSSTPLPLGSRAVGEFISAAGSYKGIGGPVSGVKLSQYANPKWDGHFAGVSVFRMLHLYSDNRRSPV